MGETPGLECLGQSLGRRWSSKMFGEKYAPIRRAKGNSITSLCHLRVEKSKGSVSVSASVSLHYADIADTYVPG